MQRYSNFLRTCYGSAGELSTDIRFRVSRITLQAALANLITSILTLIGYIPSYSKGKRQDRGCSCSYFELQLKWLWVASH